MHKRLYIRCSSFMLVNTLRFLEGKLSVNPNRRAELQLYSFEALCMLFWFKSVFIDHAVEQYRERCPNSRVTFSSEHLTSNMYLPFLAIKEENTFHIHVTHSSKWNMLWFLQFCSNFTHSISSRLLRTWGNVAQTAILEPQPLHLWLQASLPWHWKQSKSWDTFWNKN